MKPGYMLFALALAAGGAACTTAGAKDAAATAPLTVVKTNASIPFLDLDRRIQNWTVRKDGSVLFETDTHQYFRATLMTYCPGIEFVNRLRFKPGGAGQLDKFASLIVDKRECPLNTLDEVADPYAAPPTHM